MLLVGILVSILVTATLSGIFGMAGGLILMGIYLAVLPVPVAMVLHAITQLASNGYRTWLLRRHVCWPIIGRYAVGAAGSIAVFAGLRVVLPSSLIFIILGAIPLLAGLLPHRLSPRIDVPAQGYVCGGLVTAAHLVAGVSGPLLDVFYVRSELDRHAVVGTKALTQSLSHLLKLAYFGLLIPDGGLGEIPSWFVPLVVGTAFLGTTLGKSVLTRLSDLHFRQWSTWIVRGLAVVFLVRGVVALL